MIPALGLLLLCTAVDGDTLSCGDMRVRPALEMAYQALPDEDKANPWDAAEVA